MNMAAFFFGVDGELEFKKIDLIFSKAIECKWFLKVHKIENFFGSEFELYTISLLVLLKY